MQAALLSSDKQDWRTPQWLLDVVMEMCPGGIDLDPCASTYPEHHYALANLTKAEDGLGCDWAEEVTEGAGTVFVNSEYGRALPRWVAKCSNEWGEYLEVIQLAPNRPGTKWYAHALDEATAMCSLQGRLIFEGATQGAPFPSVLFYYGERPYLFCHVFDGHGDVRML
jgi:hypothetical protein